MNSPNYNAGRLIALLLYGFQGVFTEIRLFHDFGGRAPIPWGVLIFFILSFIS